MRKIHFIEQKYCPVCNEPGGMAILLPKYPITEMYVDWAPGRDNQGFLDQSVLFCGGCQHAYLEKILDARVIYENYLTTSASSYGAISCLNSFKNFVERHAQIDSSRLMLDIGGNDSTFLSYFNERHDMDLVNIDPNASGEGRYKLNKCFLEDIDLEAYKNVRKKIIVSSHTIEHLSQPSELIKKISNALTEEDYCFLQFPSLESLVSNLRFDQICHQHINYFSISSINLLLKNHGLCVVDYEYDNAHFGTLRVAAKLVSAGPLSCQSPELSHEKISHQFEQFKKYYAQLNEILEPIFNNGYGYGAGLMVPTLAYYLPVVSSLRYIFDENASKHGKRFINLPAEIISPVALDPEVPVLITSISTNSAARAIFNRLVKNEAKKIVLPTIIA
jgi:hypothetical protein